MTLQLFLGSLEAAASRKSAVYPVQYQWQNRVISRQQMTVLTSVNDTVNDTVAVCLDAK
jgi:hypothetical protein